jgi:uncharacterized protein
MMSRVKLFTSNWLYLIGMLILFATIVWLVGWYLSRSANTAITMPADFQNIVIGRTHASILKADDGDICALLMHGVRSNRMSMIDRARLLKDAGITSLLIDFQAHGETAGEQITFGFREAIDATNAVVYLRNMGHCKKIIAIGHSMGGAAALLGQGPIDVDALVLESVYPTIEEAVEDRLEKRLGTLGKIMAPLLYQQIPIRTGISLTELRPISHLAQLGIPVFIMGGTLDQHTKLAETKRMFNAAPGRKQLWLVEGAAHEDLYKFSPDLYKEKLLAFIKTI